MKDPNLNAPPCPRILLVEDDPDQRGLIAETLAIYFHNSDGDRIRTAASAAECRQMDLGAFDVVLLDYNLPDATGLEVLQYINKRADVPVIFVTGENVVATAAEAIKSGAQDYVVKLGDYLFAIPVIIEKNIRQHRIRQEKDRLQVQLRASAEEVRLKNIQLEESLAKLEHMAATDYLTGLANRRHFAGLLDGYFSEATRYDFDLTCVMIDLDNYKDLNDTLGHQMGDTILMATARVIKASLRASDLAARYGGDEFVLLLPHTSLDLGMAVAQRISEEAGINTTQYLKIGRGLTMSMGISNLSQDHPTSAEALVAMADRALYAAKAAGKSRIVTHGESRQMAAR